MSLTPYIQIARFDHWFKNVFVLPGVVIAVYDSPELLGWELLGRLAVALLSIGCVASSNYVLNEILDAPSDALHPVKKARPVPAGRVRIPLGFLEWIILAAVGLTLAFTLGQRFLAVTLVLWLMGIVYNVPPLRFKDRPYLDVLSESVNNPLRLLAGWYGAGKLEVPAASLMAAYWMLGAFFMTVKRFAEYRRIGDPEIAARYRASFAHYNEERLFVSAIYYAVSFGLFFGIFMMRYRLELLLSIPLVAGLIGYYIHLGFLEDSPAQYPERLYRQRSFMIYTAVCAAFMLILFFVDIPMLRDIFAPTLPVQ